jgi:hypothetical protein
MIRKSLPSNNMARASQDHNYHQQALGNELLLFGNTPVAQIQQHLTDIRTKIRQGNLLHSARYTSPRTRDSDTSRDSDI